MKIKKGFMLRTVANKNIVVPIGQASVDFNGLITLNDTGAFLWRELAKGCTYEHLTEELLKEYDATPEQAKEGIDAFLETARKAGVLEEN